MISVHAQSILPDLRHVRRGLQESIRALYPWEHVITCLDKLDKLIERIENEATSVDPQYALPEVRVGASERDVESRRSGGRSAPVRSSGRR